MDSTDPEWVEKFDALKEEFSEFDYEDEDEEDWDSKDWENWED